MTISKNAILFKEEGSQQLDRQRQEMMASLEKSQLQNREQQELIKRQYQHKENTIKQELDQVQQTRVDQKSKYKLRITQEQDKSRE